MPLSPNLQAALLMTVSMAGFTINDAITKSLLQSLNVAQVMFVRGLIATVLVILLAWGSGAFAKSRYMRHPLVVMRALAELGATLCFMSALMHMPLANATAILQVLPLAVTMGAALFFGEAVGWRRSLAIGAGFVGVMIIVRPGFEGFNTFSLLALLSVIFCAIRDLTTRGLPAEVPGILVSTVSSFLLTSVGGALIVPFGGWTPMSAGELGLAASAAVLVLIGYQCIIKAVRIGDISFVAPFRYTALIWSILLSFFIFGDAPDMAMIIGSLTVVVSGIYTLYRERALNRPRLPAAESTTPTMAPDGL